MFLSSLSSAFVFLMYNTIVLLFINLSIYMFMQQPYFSVFIKTHQLFLSTLSSYLSTYLTNLCFASFIFSSSECALINLRSPHLPFAKKKKKEWKSLRNNFTTKPMLIVMLQVDSITNRYLYKTIYLHDWFINAINFSLFGLVQVNSLPPPPPPIKSLSTMCCLFMPNNDSNCFDVRKDNSLNLFIPLSLRNLCVTKSTLPNCSSSRIFI